MKPKNKILITLTLALVLALTACGGENNLTQEAPSTDTFTNFVPVVSATGRVVPQQWATLSMPTGGLAVELAVQENDQVQEGQLLLRLSGTEQFNAILTAAQLELTAAQQALDDLLENADIVTTQAQQALAAARDAVRDAERELTNLSNASDQTDIDQAYANMIIALDQLEDARDNYADYANRPETNVTRATYLSILAQAEDVYDDAVRVYNNRISAANDIDIAQAEADLAFAQAQLVIALANYEDVQDGPDPDTLALAQARLDNAQAQLAAAQASLEDLELTAPFDGVVTQINVRQSEWLLPSQPVIILGDLSQLQVETTDLNEIDVARIHIGSRATVTFDALPDVSVEATVIRIATKSSPGTGVNYTVILELDEIPEGLLWDMTAFVDIEVE